MFGPWVEVFHWLKDNFWPSTLINKRRLNFITIHYLYLISWAIIGSILIFPAGGISYIDALFMACGSATQSGLNTVNVNALNTEQQVVLYLIGMVCSPIFINTFVVFVRLYWFEKRFQNIVQEARNWRHSRTRTMTEPKVEQDGAKKEKGIRGQNIVVLHNGETQNDVDADMKENTDGSRSGSSSDQAVKAPLDDPHTAVPVTRGPTFHRDITFADEVRPPRGRDNTMPMLPQQASPEEHLAFLENQRNPKDTGPLRIPGPKDFDRGLEPRQLSRDEIENEVEMDEKDSPIEQRKNITFDEPDQRRVRVDSTVSSRHYNRPRAGTNETAAEESAPATSRFLNLRAKAGTFSSLRNWASTDQEPVTPYLSWQPTIGRNSAFVDLTEEQREELGGIEYRSLKTLAIVLVLYYVGWHLVGLILLLPWILHTPTWGSVVENDGQSRTWWGIFTPASMFNDLGFTLTPDSMESFQFAVLPLLLGAFLIVIGNTGFPCMLRLTIWILSKMVRSTSGVWEEFRFLLDHPRRCFTLLFPTKATWWLFWILVVLNGVDTIFFVLLDLDDPTVTGLNPPGFRVLNGLFQAASTRTAGFASVDIANLHPAIQVSYMIMMYISVFPIAISVRRTNVYEEKSLGIYGTGSEDAEDAAEPSYVGAHLRRQLSFDLWYLALGLFIIAIVEGDQLSNGNQPAFTIFSCLFEIVSAYGTVGLSLGYPNVDTSLSGQFHSLSKLVIIAMQIRGRHRGLPYELDRAIMLPSDALHQKEDADASRRAQRRNSSLSQLDLANGRHPSSRPPTMPRSRGASLFSHDGRLPNAVTAPAATAGADHVSGQGTSHTGNLTSDIGHESGVHSGHMQRGIGNFMSSLTERTKRARRRSFS